MYVNDTDNIIHTNEADDRLTQSPVSKSTVTYLAKLSDYFSHTQKRKKKTSPKLSQQLGGRPKGVQSQHDVNLLRRFFLQFKLEINTMIRHLTRAVLVLPKNFLHCDKNRNKLVFASASRENTTNLCRILIACTGQSCTSALIVYFFNLVYKKHSSRYKLRGF